MNEIRKTASWAGHPFAGPLKAASDATENDPLHLQRLSALSGFLSVFIGVHRWSKNVFAVRTCPDRNAFSQ
jgi:hypothetical protein